MARTTIGKKAKAMWTLLGAMALVVTTGMPAQAITYTVDTILAGIASTSSGQQEEQNQLQLICGCTVSLLSNVNTNTFAQDGAGNNYIDVAPATPGYFLLKFGTGNTGNDMFFFQNIGELDKLVWTNGQLTQFGLPDNHILSISHYAITATDTPPSGNVPEPASLLLLGAGLAGVSFFRRKTA